MELALADEKHGFCHKIVLKCLNCEDQLIEPSRVEVYSSKRLMSTKSTRPPFDVNLRISTAFLFFGKNYAAIEQFAMIMNMQCFCLKTFQENEKLLETSATKSVEVILEASRTIVKEEYRKLEANESNDNGKANERNDENTIQNVDVTYDGSWPQRGHSSLHGFGSVIDILTGFVIDFEVVSKFCHVCKQAIADLGEDSPEFFFWYEGHAPDCPINHQGSSGAMEISAAQIIWLRSVSKGVRFLVVLSDGDAKTVIHLRTLNIYGDEFIIEKEECVNHVSKRYTRELSHHYFLKNYFYFISGYFVLDSTLALQT